MELICHLLVGVLWIIRNSDKDMVAIDVIMHDVLDIVGIPAQNSNVFREVCSQVDGTVYFLVFVATGVVGDIKQTLRPLTEFLMVKLKLSMAWVGFFQRTSIWPRGNVTVRVSLALSRET